MPDQADAVKEPEGRDQPGTSRRRFLAGLPGSAAATGAIAAGLSGCVSLGATASGRAPVEILAAGSLQRTLGQGLRDAVDVPITVEAHGSVTAARLVAGGQRDPDVVALADAALFDSVLDGPWYATMATNALVVAYADRPGGNPVATASPWFAPVLAGECSLGRTDPALDPLGYRTVFAADLGAEFYDRPGLHEALLSASSIYPETSLVSRLEAGAVDAAVVYRSMATERDYASIDLPAPIDLSDSTRDYSTARYELDDGTTVRGAPIAYGVRARRESGPVRAVFDALVRGDVLDAHGFGTADPLPTFHGDVPDGFEG